jgi:parallel beta-helix repeat protein
MKKMTKRLLYVMAAMALMICASILLSGGIAQETVLAAKTDYSSCYKVSGQTITIKKGYTNKDITEILNAALVEARDSATAKKPVTVKLPKGTYKLTSNLRIFSNTTLDLSGVTLKYTGKESHVMLQSGTNGSYKGVSDYNQSKKCAGYNGFENITIKGGTFVSSTSNTGSIMRIAHAKNVTLEGITFQGGGCAHQVEVAAINGFYVKDCVFKDWDGEANPEEGYENEKFEALQLDIPCATKVYRNVYQDGTVMKNVEVTGCTFENLPRGVGTHTFLLGAYHENIKINNNTFKNIEEEAIVCLGYKNSEVKDNTIIDCGAGILFQYFKANTDSVYSTILDGKKKASGKVEHDANSVISGNNITVKYTKESDEIQGIKVYGVNLEKAEKGADGKKLAAQDYYISGVTVTKNTIVTAGYGIHLIDAKDCTITDNKITGKDVKSSDPLLKITNYDGIYLTESSTAKNIKNNKVSDMIGYGIDLFDSSKVTGAISGNTVTGCKDGGMLVNASSTVKKITGNTFKKVTGDSAITVYSKAKVTEISDNTIEVTGSAKKGNTHGIKATTNATVGSISGNKIGNGTSTAKLGCGIIIYSDSKVTGSISDNTVDDPKEYGISISTNASVGGSIDVNTISNPKKSGIFVYSGSSVGGNISGNKVNGASDDGILINASAKVSGGINSNEITSAGKRGIFIYDDSGKSTVSEIKNNTITSTGSYGINLTSTTNDVTVSGNNISGCKAHCLMIQPSSGSYCVTVSDNTIQGSGASYSAIHIVKGKVYVSNNTLSNAGYGVHVAKGVTGTIDWNTYGDGISNQIYLAGKSYSQTYVIQL